MIWHQPQRRHTVVDVLREGAERWPDRVCMEFRGERITFADMISRSIAVANGFHGLGLRAGDRVAIQSQNCPEMLYTWFGATLVGALTVPINWNHKGSFLHHQLAVGAPQIVVIPTSRWDRVSAVLGELPTVEHVLIHVEDEPSTDRTDLPTDRLSDLLDGKANRLDFTHEPTWTDANYVAFTGGTTGASKAAVWSHHNMLAVAEKYFRAKGAGEDDVFWSPLPLFHGNAVVHTVLGPMMHGARGALDGRFSLSGFWPRVRAVGATQVSVLGSMFTMLWNRPPAEDDLDNPVRCFFGAPLPADIHAGFQERFGVQYVTAYGLSEAQPILSSSVDDPPPPGTCGRANDWFEVRLVDEDDLDVPDGEVGEIVCRPCKPNIMFDGYLDDAQATLQTLENLWFHTGDYGRRRSDGWYCFVDRKKDYMRRRGENVSSWEVEQTVLTHPAIAEAMAFGVPSEVSEDDIMLVVALADGAMLAHEEVLDHCAANMPYFAVPRYVEISPTGFSNDLGRIPKHQFRARGVTATTWDREATGYVVER